MNPLMRIYCRPILAALLCWGWATPILPGADHRESPALLNSSAVGARDINDIYIFQSPSSSSSPNTVMIMTVNPFVGSGAAFDPDASYDFLIDNDGDAKPDVTFRATFSKPNSSGVQDLLLRCTPAARCGQGGAVLARGVTGSTIAFGAERIHAGLFDDPFFFDSDALSGRGGRTFCDDDQNDFFAGFNTLAIVLEIDNERILGRGADPNIGLWARTELDGVQVDRMGRPAINTVLIPTRFKDVFNDGKPQRDRARFRDIVIQSLLGLGNDSTRAAVLADILLPDILTVDVGNPAGFLNGRKLEDDVIDAELNLLTNGAITGDCIDENDKDFLTVFPYLAAPH